MVIEQVTRDVVEPKTLVQIAEQFSSFHFLISAHVCFASTNQSIFDDLLSLAHDCIQMSLTTKTFSVDLVDVLSA